MNKQIYSSIVKEMENNSIFWLATVVNPIGSTPGRVGMKMIIKSNAEIAGTIGGGAIEARVIKKTLEEKPIQAVCWGFDLGNQSGFEKTGMICGGSQEVLIEPIQSEFIY